MNNLIRNTFFAARSASFRGDFHDRICAKRFSRRAVRCRYCRAAVARSTVDGSDGAETGRAHRQRTFRRYLGTAGLSKRDRSLITVATLIALNRPDQLRSHLALARQNGATEEELVEVITHLAFYAGWPSAVSAVAVAREVFQKN